MSKGGKIAFRTNANMHIGLGHLARCVSLSLHLEGLGANCCIVVDRLHDSLRPFLKGINTISLYGELEMQSEQDDARTFLDRAIDGKVDWAIVDDYRLGPTWETVVKSSGIKVAAIDDLLRPHECDLVIDTLWRGQDTDKAYNALVPDTTVKLLGPAFTILAPEYMRGITTRKSEEDQPFYITLGLGGGGDLSLLAHLIDALFAKTSEAGIPIAVTAIVGPLSPDPENFVARLANRGEVTTVVGKSDLFEEFCATDLYVGAAGGTISQLLALGIPAISFSISEAQASQVRNLEEIGHYFHLGTVTPDNAQLVADLILTIARAYDRVLSICRHARTPIDGRGAIRIGEHLLFGASYKEALTVHTSTPDADKLAELENGIDIRPAWDNEINDCLRCRRAGPESLELDARANIQHYLWWFRSDVSVFVALRDNAKLFYFWHILEQGDPGPFLRKGRFDCINTVSAADIAAVETWQIQYCKERHPAVPWFQDPAQKAVIAT